MSWRLLPRKQVQQVFPVRADKELEFGSEVLEPVQDAEILDSEVESSVVWSLDDLQLCPWYCEFGEDSFCVWGEGGVCV